MTHCINKIVHMKIKNTTKIIKNMVTIPVSINLKKSYSCICIIETDKINNVYNKIAISIPFTSPVVESGRKFVANVTTNENRVNGKSEYVVATYTSLNVPFPENIEQTSQLHSDQSRINPAVEPKIKQRKYHK